MKKFLVLAVCVVLLAAVALALSNVFVSLDAVNTTGAGASIAVNQGSSITWETVFTGTPTAITVNLEGSIDGTNWFVLDTSTSTTNEMRHVVYKPVDALRCNISAYTVNSSKATCAIKVYAGR